MDGRDEVLALKELLQQMLLADQEPEQKGVVRNDRLLELIGVAPSELSASDDSVASPEDSEEAAVAPLDGQRVCLDPKVVNARGRVDPVADSDSSAGCIELPEEESIPRGSFSAGIRVSKTSAELLRKSATFEPDFQTRMKQFLIKNQQKKDKMRQSLAVEEDADVISMPRINQRSKYIPRNVSHLMAWNHEKQSKLARMRDAEKARQEEEYVGKPYISKHSASLFAKRQDDVAMCKVEDRLHLLGLIYQYQQEERKRAQERQSTTGLQPRLAPHSVNIQGRRRLSVHERLYQLSKRETALKSNNEYEDHVQTTTTRRKRDRSAHDKCFEDTVKRLHALERQYKEKQHLMSEKREQYFENLRKEPKMSARSRKLAAKRKLNSAPKSPLRCSCCGGREATDGTCGCTVQPRINQKHAVEIYDRHMRWKHGNEAKHSQQKQLQETMAMAECTFRNPFYQKAWSAFEDRSEKPTKAGTDKASAAFFKRCMSWADKRDRRLAREKKESQERLLEECTFKPRVTRRPAAARRKRPSNQLEDGPPASRLSALSCFLDCSDAADRDQLAHEELLSQLYSALDLEALAGELSPAHTIGSDDEGAHGLPKYSFTGLGAFAGR